MDVNQEDLDKLEFSLNNYLEDEGTLVELTINDKDISIKRNKSMYFIDESDELNITPIEVNPYIKWTAVFFSAQTILFYLYWTPLIEFINRSLIFWNS